MGGACPWSRTRTQGAPESPHSRGSVAAPCWRCACSASSLQPVSWASVSPEAGGVLASVDIRQPLDHSGMSALLPCSFLCGRQVLVSCGCSPPGVSAWCPGPAWHVDPAASRLWARVSSQGPEAVVMLLELGVHWLPGQRPPGGADGLQVRPSFLDPALLCFA